MSFKLWSTLMREISCASLVQMMITAGSLPEAWSSFAVTTQFAQPPKKVACRENGIKLAQGDDELTRDVLAVSAVIKTSHYIIAREARGARGQPPYCFCPCPPVFRSSGVLLLADPDLPCAAMQRVVQDHEDLWGKTGREEVKDDRGFVLGAAGLGRGHGGRGGGETRGEPRGSQQHGGRGRRPLCYRHESNTHRGLRLPRELEGRPDAGAPARGRRTRRRLGGVAEADVPASPLQRRTLAVRHKGAAAARRRKRSSSWET